MKQAFFKVLENTALTGTVYRMVLEGDTEGIRTGQFVNLKLDGLFLRRPISVCEVTEGVLTLVYKVVGKGTEQMSRMQGGEVLDVLTGLGNGYDLSLSGDRPLLIGGGVGVPPLYQAAKELRAAGKDVSVILGFNTKDEIFYEQEFAALGCHVTVTTVDGSCGVKGFVTDAMQPGYTYIYTYNPIYIYIPIHKYKNKYILYFKLLQAFKKFLLNLH